MNEFEHNLKLNKVIMAEANKHFDIINQGIEEIETIMVSNGIIRPVAYRFDTDQTYDYYLGIKKFKGKWKLAYGVALKDQTEITWLSYTETPIETRTELCNYFEKLYEEVVKSNKLVVTCLSDYSSSVTQILAKLKGAN